MAIKTINYLPELRLGDEKTLNQTIDLRVLSFGAGVQSSYLLFQMLEEKIKPPDLALFADTGNEPKEVYDWLHKLMNITKNKINIEIIKNNENTGNIIDDYQSENGRYGLIPTHILKSNGESGFGRRTCTFEYKIKPINNRIRQELGTKTLRGKVVEVVMGISIDELQRVKKSSNKWEIKTYPLIENKIHREDCVHYFKHSKYGTPPRSACIVCPYHSNKEWKRLKNNHPDEWEFAIKFDDWLRDENSTSYGLDKFRKSGSQQFLHKDKIPLKVADLRTQEDYQYSLFDDECEGICGV